MACDHVGLSVGCISCLRGLENRAMQAESELEVSRAVMNKLVEAAKDLLGRIDDAEPIRSDEGDHLGIEMSAHDFTCFVLTSVVAEALTTLSGTHSEIQETEASDTEERWEFCGICGEARVPVNEGDSCQECRDEQAKADAAEPHRLIYEWKGRCGLCGLERNDPEARHTSQKGESR